MEPAATPTIPIGTPTELLPWIHAASLPGVNDATALGNVALPSFPRRNLPYTQDDDIVLWQYYRSGHEYGMAQRNEILRQQIPRPPRTQNHEHTQRPKLAPPKTFHGQQSEFTRFLIQFTLIYETDPDRYSTDAAKIAFAASYLDGSAEEWVKLHVDLVTGTTPTFPTWASFTQALKAAFDDPDAYQTAEEKIHKLKQGNRDYTKYYTEFITYATILEWDERTKISFFKRGLNGELQKLLLTNTDPTRIFTEYVSFAIKLDNNLRAHKQRKYITSRTNDGRFSQPTPTTATGSHPGPMDLSATRHLNYQNYQNYQKFISQKRGPIDQNERDRRRDNNLCMYCGNPGHWASTCPLKKNKTSNRPPAKAATAEVEPAEIINSNTTFEEVLYESKKE